MTKTEKHLLEAQKTVVANLLAEWREKWGMDYLLVVKNSERSYFAHSHLDADSVTTMTKLVEKSLKVRP